MTTNREIDAVTGVETTGHEWDGIKELNKPLPRWWLLTFYATIVWAIGYWVVYPAFPTLTGYTKGLWNYSQRSTVASDVKVAQDAQSGYRAKLSATALADIKKDPDLLRFAVAGGNAAFQTNCAPCHGRGAQGFVGFPNLNDDDWLWGGKLDEIQATILHGIRADDKETRSNQMPRYGIEKLMDEGQINDAAEFVLKISGQKFDAAAAERGVKTFNEQCATCHGPEGKGLVERGAPNLTDGIWLYGGTKADILDSIRTGRGGVMPAWASRLDAITVKSLAVYVHSLGGGR